MKPNYNINIVISILFILCCGITDLSANTMVQKKGRTRIKVYYEKLDNNDRQLTVILNQGSGKKMAGVQDVEVFLTTYNLDTEVELPTLVTDENGEAILIIEANYPLPLNEDGFTIIKAVYEGNDELKGAKKQIKFMDVNIELAFDIVDSVKQLTISTMAIDSAGNKTPVSGVELNIGVERLYSILYLEKIESSKEGKTVMEFPSDLPGDSVGVLKVIVKVSEDKIYGTVTKSSQIDWGTVVDYSNTHSDRSLFGVQAPLWMIIAIFIILAGAWYHFILAITKVLKMRSLAKIEPLNEL